MYNEIVKKFPGPGSYSHEGISMNAKMSHILSHYFNSGRCPTTRTKRVLFKLDKIGLIKKQLLALEPIANYQNSL